MADPKSGGGDDITASGKYLLISVPEFGLNPISGKPMTSYLRLGASSSTWEQDPGGKLAKNIYLGGPPGGHLPEIMEQVEERSEAYPFVDDRRFRGVGDTPAAGAAGHGLVEAQRALESSILHTKGGWRDHSDGNRITTTEGDKIEIIRGNYKMIVLGRQADQDGEEFGNASGWDVSGQHIQDFAATMPGASVRVEWVRDKYNGLWHLQNTTENVQQSSRFAGTFKEEWWGDLIENYVGQEKAAAMADRYTENIAGADIPRGNPRLLNKTWSAAIEDYTGSAAVRIPTIREETWAEVITSVTDATSIDETTTAADKITSTTTASDTEDTTKVSGSIKDSTEAGTIEEMTKAGAMTDTTLAGAITSTTLAGIVVDTTVATKIETNIGLKTDIFVGNHTGLFVGLEEELFVGGKLSVEIAYAINITMGKYLDVILGTRVEFNNAGVMTFNGPQHVELTMNVAQMSAQHVIGAAMTLFL